eukprot:jgi/Chrzof1/12407/Cz06g33110.t1
MLLSSIGTVCDPCAAPPDNDSRGLELPGSAGERGPMTLKLWWESLLHMDHKRSRVVVGCPCNFQLQGADAAGPGACQGICPY